MHNSPNTKKCPYSALILCKFQKIKKYFQLVKIFETFPQYTVFNEPTTLFKIGDNFLIVFVQFRLMSKKVTSCLG